MASRFRCLQCGDCCANLVTSEWSGLSLFPWEMHLFPESKVIPSLGYGDSPDSDRFRVFLYKYVNPVCEKLEENKCTIHETRPLVCRSYPFRYVKVGKNESRYEAAPECTAIAQKPRGEGSISKFPELYSAEEISYHLTYFYTMKEKKWQYDALSERWVPFSPQKGPQTRFID
ncbi:MAG: YkgJ family cysteine cluster protein [Candidatus Bathyarchaeota archaeon]|nr:YkgJ family cysteine cluster protein [Candidatus Bathyarchaeota archaeon]